MIIVVRCIGKIKKNKKNSKLRVSKYPRAASRVVLSLKVEPNNNQAKSNYKKMVAEVIAAKSSTAVK